MGEWAQLRSRGRPVLAMHGAPSGEVDPGRKARTFLSRTEGGDKRRRGEAASARRALPRRHRLVKARARTELFDLFAPGRLQEAGARALARRHRLERRRRVVEAAESDGMHQDALRSAAERRGDDADRSAVRLGVFVVDGGGTWPRRSVRQEAIAWSALEPAPCCPSIDLIEVTGIVGKRSPKTLASACASTTS